MKKGQAASKRRPKENKPTRIQTRVGRLVKLGVNEWGKPLVRCPQCGGAATTGRTGDISCRECGYSTLGLSGCG